MNTHTLNTSSVVPFYFDQEVVNVATADAMRYLSQYECFSVFISFVHPATGIFIEERATFYPNPQTSYGQGGFGGQCFLTEIQGLLIRIPANMEFWSREQGPRKEATFQQQLSYLHRGEIASAAVEIEVLRYIRIPRKPISQPTAVTGRTSLQHIAETQ